MDKIRKIDCNNEGRTLHALAKALGSPLRVSIMQELAGNAMSVNEIAFKLNIPLSTASANVKMLEDAKLIRTQYQAGKHGSIKLCAIMYETLTIDFAKSQEAKNLDRYVVNMPIGGFFDIDIKPTCGMVDEFAYIERDDDVRSFYSPGRLKAQLLWFNCGYIEYRFPLSIDSAKITRVQFSLEACSEAPGYRNDYPSDITFWVNGKEICDWQSPGDFGGVRGEHTPQWWAINSTQYGILKKLSVTDSGSFLDESFVSSINLKQLDMQKRDYITFRVGIKPASKNIGGINIFGKKFGNYAQDIVMLIEYEKKLPARQAGRA